MTLLKQLGLPPISQLGHVVRNLEASMALYEPLYGPFSTMDGTVQAPRCRVRGSQR